MKNTTLLEKIGVALLLFGVLIYSSINLGNVLVHAEEGNIAALRIATADTSDQANEATEEATGDFGTLLASADMAAGTKMFKKCASCHTITEGGKNKVGPNLWGVVGRTQGGAAGFGYSDVIAGLGGTWTAGELNLFLESPKAYAKGNKMTFKGIGDPAKRAALIAYLMSQGG